MRLVRPESTNKLTLPMLMLIGTFAIPHVSSIAPFITEMSEEFDVSEGLTGQMGSISFAGTFLMAIIVLPFVGGISLRWLLALSLIASGVFTVLTAITPSFWLVMGTRFCAGVGAGSVMAAGMGAVGRGWPDPNQRVKRIGLVLAASAGGPGFWAPILRISDQSSWQTGVLTYAIASIAVGVLAWIALPGFAGQPQPSVTIKARIKSALALLRYPVLGHVYLSRAISTAMIGTIFGFIAAFNVHFYPSSDEWTGPMIAAAAAGFMVMALSSGVAIRASGGAARALLLFTVVMVADTTLLAWVTPDPLVTTAWLVIWGASAAVVMSSSQELLFRHSGENQTPAVFMTGVIGPLGNVIGVIIGGIAFDASADLAPFRWYITIVGLAIIPPTILAVREANARHVVEPAPAPD